MADEYDLRKLIQRTYDNIPCGTEPEKAAVTVRIFDVEDEVNLSEIGAYRKGDIVSMIESALESKEKRMLAKTNNLESIAKTSEEVSSFRIAYEVVKEYGKICFAGALPMNYFTGTSNHTDYNTKKYIFTNALVMGAAEIGSMVYFGLSRNIPLAVLSCALAITDLIRMWLNPDGYRLGHPLLTIPYYSIKLPYWGIKALTKDIKERFKQKKKELEMEYTPKLYQIETTEAKQLPSPDREAIVNTELVEELLDRKLK